MQPIPRSQRDPQWANIILGQSTKSIGTHGCTITAIAMKFGVDPKFVNERLNAVDGYLAENPGDPFNPQKDLVIWKKLEQALPGVVFNYKYNNYDDNIVKANLPCIVEVDGAPIGGSRHWVLYIGDGQLIDPWDGKVKPISIYKPLSFVVLTGAYKEVEDPVKPIENPTIAYTPEYVKQLEADRLKFWQERDQKQVQIDILSHEIETLKKQFKFQTENAPEDQNYTELKAHGYIKIDDVENALANAGGDCKDIKKRLIDTLDDNVRLHQMLGEKDRMDNEVLKQSLNAIEENRELKETVAEVVKETGAEKPTKKSIIERIFFLRERAELNLKKLEENQGKDTMSPPKVKKASNEPSFFDLLLGFLTPPSKEVGKTQ